MGFQVDLPAFADRDEIRELLTIWHKWAEGAAVPNREQMNLRDISKYLDCVMLFDVISHEEINIRYFASLYMDYFGADYTGKNYLDVTDPELRQLRAARMMNVVSHPCAAVWTTLGKHEGKMQEYTVGLSVPVVACEKGLKPMQMLQVCFPLSGRERPSFSDQPVSNVTVANNHMYVDIGAGVPEGS